MGKYKNSRKRAGTLLALLSVMSAGAKSKNVGAMDNGVYSGVVRNNDSQIGQVGKYKNNLGTEVRSGANNQFKTLKVEIFENMEQAMSAADSCVETCNFLIESSSALQKSGEKFVNSVGTPLPEAPGFFARLFGMSSVRTAADSAERVTLTAVQDMKNVIAGIEGFKKSFNNFKNIGTYTKNEKFRSIMDSFEALNLNFSDLDAAFNEFNSKASQASGMGDAASRYDAWASIHRGLLASGQATNGMILPTLKTMNNNLELLKEELANLPSAYDAYTVGKEHDKMRKLTELKESFEKEKVKKQNELKEVQKNLEGSYKGTWKSIEKVDPDISALIQNEFDSKFQDLNDEISRVIDTISAGLRIYNEDSVAKLSSMKNVVPDFEEKIQRFLGNIESYKSKCIKEKKKLKIQKDELIKQVNNLQSELDSVWTIQCSNFKSENDLNRFVETAKSGYDAAKKLCNQLLVETENIELNLNTQNPNQSLDSGLKRINDRKPRIEAAIAAIREKGLMIRITVSRNAIEVLLQERDDIWNSFNSRYSPKMMDNERLIEDSAEIYQSMVEDYNEERSFQADHIDGLLKDKHLTEELAEKHDSVWAQLANRLGTFKKGYNAAVAKIGDLVAKIQADIARRRGWERMFMTTGNYDNIRKEVGDAYLNRNDDDSQKIAEVIDRYLPGTYDNVLDLCNKMRQKVGTEFVLVSGAPGWGKTQSIDYLINATRATKINVEYSKLLKSVDGVSYARELLNKHKGKSEPLVMVLDEFDIVAKKREEGTNSPAGIINAFFDEVKKMSEDPQSRINLRLIVNISNMSKDQLDAANINRMTGYLTFGSNPDYAKIISVISEGVECDAAEGTKENFIKSIARTCNQLATSMRAPSARTIVKAFQAVMSRAHIRINKGKNEKDRDFVQLWNTPVTSENISKDITSLVAVS